MPLCAAVLGNLMERQPLHRLLFLAHLTLGLGVAGVATPMAFAQSAPSGAPADASAKREVDAFVAKALVDRGMVLFRAADYRSAKQLFVEALVRDPGGPYAATARDLLRKTNQKLGYYDRDHGAPPPVPPRKDEKPAAASPPPPAAAGTADQPVDPYATPGRGSGTGGAGAAGADEPVDPYAESAVAAPLDPYAAAAPSSAAPPAPGETLVDPYATPPAGPPTGPPAGDLSPVDPYAVEPGDEPALGGHERADTGPPSPGPPAAARRELMLGLGAYGFLAGTAVVGTDSEAGLAAGLIGGAAGLGAGALLGRRRDMTHGQVMALNVGMSWGAADFAFLGHLADGQDATGTSLFRYAAVGGLVGAGAGVWAGRRDPDPGDVALVNSLMLYGTAGGLLLGVAMDPPREEAYSLNAILGNAAGVVGGLTLAPKMATSRRRMVRADLGAALGAGATWALFYPLVKDDSGFGDEQITGFVSVLGMGLGAYLGWRWSGPDRDEAATAAPEPPPVARRRRAPPSPAPPALLGRDSSGRWTLAAPLLRPISDPALASPAGAFARGADLLAGSF
jgi:hypothetical protein